MSRQDLQQIAYDTVNILKEKKYAGPAGEVSLEADLAYCLSRSKQYEPGQIDRLKMDVLALESLASQDADRTIEFFHGTTLEAARRLAPHGSVGVLNFASARHPGGGFLNGARAQEESLARSSALYACLKQHPEFYEKHTRNKSGLYSDSMIYSPGCPVFKDDDGKLLDQPYLVDFVTSPAPNAGRLMREERQGLEEVIDRRSGKIMTLFAAHSTPTIVLGAWGCGVFRNDPGMVARAFKKHLEGDFKNCFRHVCFAILDERMLDVFRKCYE